MEQQKTTGFENFFQAMSSTPEYKTMMEGMIDIQSMEKELQETDKQSSKIKSIQSNLLDVLNTAGVKKVGGNTDINNGENTTHGKEKQEQKESISIEYFKRTNPATWGFAGVAGMKDLKKELQESFINPLKFTFFIQKIENEQTHQPSISETENTKIKELYKQIYKTYKNFKVGIPTGVLFYGPPGTGKTYLSKKMAEELGAGFIRKSVGEFGSSYIHQTSKNIHNFFSQAKKASKKGPIILFLDEIDSLVSKRTGSSDGNKAEEVSQFLQEFNNLDDVPNLIIIGATNRPDHLDSAILRSGRFDKKIYIGESDYEARKELFQIFIEKQNRPHTALDYRELAMLTEGYVAADIESIVKEAARDASQGILDLVQLLQKGKYEPGNIEKELSKHTISMKLLKKSISETTSSLKMVDMSIYTQWLEKIQ